MESFRTISEAEEFLKNCDYPASITSFRSGTSHPYDVIRMPIVGDEISYAFNGDCYPCGTVTRVTNTKCVTSDGTIFRRLKNGRWKKDRIWSMVFGHIYTQNPEF